MLLSEEIKDRVKAALKAGRDVEKNILRLVLAEVQKLELEQNKTVEDSSVHKILRKMILANQETLAYGPNSKLDEEIQILAAMIPQQWSEEQIQVCLSEIVSQLKEAKNDGQATGVAMKFLKEKGAAVDGKVVGTVVAALRKS